MDEHEALERIAANRHKRDEHTAAIAALDEELAGPDGLVRAAFDAGATGPRIASVARLSKQRVYQVRDGVR
ncbi:hypothetical protein ABLE94_02980 [Gordonia sp. VNK1]|uniref:hypothetical protein n=1 Tax=Gordonia oleivorans TaxID=3156618 RepID=UPI0032B4979F